MGISSGDETLIFVCRGVGTAARGGGAAALVGGKRKRQWSERKGAEQRSLHKHPNWLIYLPRV